MTNRKWVPQQKWNMTYESGDEHRSERERFLCVVIIINLPAARYPHHRLAQFISTITQIIFISYAFNITPVQIAVSFIVLFLSHQMTL